jgi:ribose 5-phosphate isomerase B
MTIAANKIKGIRASQSNNVNDVIHNRSHNDTNILVIAAGTTNMQTARLMVEAFLDTTYVPEERFVRRLSKIAAREK